MSGTQFLSILRECSGAPRSKTRISLLYYIGSFAVWRGVEYGLVHAILPCTGGVRRQFENCGTRPQYRKTACAPLSRRYWEHAAEKCLEFAVGSTAWRLSMSTVVRAARPDLKRNCTSVRFEVGAVGSGASGSRALIGPSLFSQG